MSQPWLGNSTQGQAHSRHCPLQQSTTRPRICRVPKPVSRQSRCQVLEKAATGQSRDLKSDAELFAEEVGAQDTVSPEAALPDASNIQQLRQDCAAAAKQVEAVRIRHACLKLLLCIK